MTYEFTPAHCPGRYDYFRDGFICRGCGAPISEHSAMSHVEQMSREEALKRYPEYADAINRAANKVT